MDKCDDIKNSIKISKKFRKEHRLARLAKKRFKTKIEPITIIRNLLNSNLQFGVVTSQKSRFEN